MPCRGRRPRNKCYQLQISWAGADNVDANRVTKVVDELNGIRLWQAVKLVYTEHDAGRTSGQYLHQLDRSYAGHHRRLQNHCRRSRHL